MSEEANLVTRFERVEITPEGDSHEFVRGWDDGYDASAFLVAASSTGRKSEPQEPESTTDE